MSYGIKIVQSNGQVIDLSAAGATFVDLIEVPADAYGYRDYPWLAGMQIFGTETAIAATAFGTHNAWATYDLGYPRINWAPTGGPGPHSATQILVFAK